MFPCLSIDDTQRGKLGDTIVVCKSLRRDTTSGIVRTNFMDLLFSQLGFVRLFTARERFRMRMTALHHSLGLASLGYTIQAITHPGSWPQMMWIATRRIIAVMAQGAISSQRQCMPQFPDNAMRAIGTMVLLIGYRDRAIAIFIAAFGPRPTAIETGIPMRTLLDTIPQSLQQGFFWRSAMRPSMSIHIGIMTDAANTLLAIWVPLVIAKVVEGFFNETGNARFHVEHLCQRVS
jgi:hypothetical protein